MENKPSIKDLTDQVALIRATLEKADKLIQTGTLEAAQQLDGLARELRYQGHILSDMSYELTRPRS